MVVNKFYFYPISIFIGISLYYLLFMGSFIIPDYAFGNPQFCVDILEYKLGNNTYFKYPFSCDQNFYYSGFEDFREVFKETYNYQSRPLFILGGFIFYNIVNFIVNIFSLDFNYITQLSTFLYQISIINFIVYLLYKSFNLKTKFTNLNYFVLLTFVMLNPIYKWGIFVPSHQTATLLLIAFFIFFASKKNLIIDYKVALLFGLFFLFHRSFLISYLALVLFKNLNKLMVKETYIKNSYLFLFFLLPNIIYESFIRFVLQRSTYDANTEYWGQFIWLFDFIRGKIRYVSEWHCVTIPENFICYLSDLKRMFFYIFLPVLVIGLLFLVNLYFEKNKKYDLLYESGFITISLFLFWSLIGWYPPVRFNFYSIGHFITILFFIFYLNQENLISKLIVFSVFIVSYIFIPHWNIPEEAITFGVTPYFSIIMLALFFVFKILERRKEYK